MNVLALALSAVILAQAEVPRDRTQETAPRPSEEQTLAQGMRMLEQGRYGPAWELLRPLADADRPEAQFAVSRMLAEGLGRPKDEKGARTLLERCAGLVHVPCMLGMGQAEAMGLGGERPDEARATRWFRLAAESGSAYGQLLFGLRLIAGAGIERDPEAGYRMVLAAAEGGLPDAMTRLGDLHAAGDVVRQDPAEAEKWYRKAIREGDTVAMNNLAYMLARRGERLTEALNMIQLSITSGGATAYKLDTLGYTLFRMGRPTEARKHLEQARALDPDNAEIALNLAETLLALGETTSASKLAQEAEKGLEGDLADLAREIARKAREGIRL
jgi:TPR repeat protein